MRGVTIALVVLSLVLLAFAIPDDMYVVSSGQKTADTQIFTGAGFVWGVAITTDGSNAVTLALHDGDDNTDTRLTPDLVAPASSTNRVYTFRINPPVSANDGVYADITCSGTGKYIVYYREQ